MNVFTSVIISSLPETFLIVMLFPFCCQISSKCKHLCFPLTTNFKYFKMKCLKAGNTSEFFNK